MYNELLEMCKFCHNGWKTLKTCDYETNFGLPKTVRRDTLQIKKEKTNKIIAFYMWLCNQLKFLNFLSLYNNADQPMTNFALESATVCSLFVRLWVIILLTHIHLHFKLITYKGT